MRTLKLSTLHKTCLFLFIISVGVYANTLWNGYVYDDVTVITQNSFVKKGFGGMAEILATPRLYGFEGKKDPTYRPLCLLLFAAEYAVFGSNPAEGHLINILLFAACVILLFRFLDKLFNGQKTTVCLAAACLFALHPVHTEVVANIKSRDELLCFAFAFLSLIRFIDYAETGKRQNLIIGAVALFASFLAKETVISFVLVIPLIFFFYKNEDRKRSIYVSIVSCCIALLYLGVRWKVLSGYSLDHLEFIDNPLVDAPTAASKLATCLYITGDYIRLLFIPFPLICDYDISTIPYCGFGNALVWLSLAGVTFLVIAGLYRLIKFPKDPWAFSILFFLFTIVLFTNLLMLIGAEMAERFLFFASAGFCLFMALAVEQLLARWPVASTPLRNKVILFAVLPVGLIYALVTIVRNTDWKNNATLFSADLAKAPYDRRLNESLAKELMANVYPYETNPAAKKAILEKSVACFKKITERYPDDLFSYLYISKTYFVDSCYDSAAHYCLKALAINPGHPRANLMLGEIYLKAAHPLQAIHYYKLAFDGPIPSASICNAIGICYMQLHAYDSATRWLHKTLDAQPGFPDARFNLGMSYLAETRYDSAQFYLEQEIALQPGNLNAANNLAGIYYNAGAYAQSIRLFRKIVDADPRNVLAWSNLGHCYFKLGQYDSAIATLNRSLLIDHSYIPDVVMLGKAYRATGQTEMARKFEDAIDRLHKENKK